MDQSKEDSLGKRYFYKLGASVLSVPLNLIIQALSARMLGPIQYGNFSFLSNFFQSLISFFDSGSSMRFYSMFSHRHQDKSLLTFNWFLIFIIFVLTFLSVILAFYLDKDSFLWPHQTPDIVWLALAFAFFIWVSQTIQRIVDGYGVTTSGEIVKLAHRAGTALLFTLIFISIGSLSLQNYFLCQYFVVFSLCAGWWYILRIRKLPVFPTLRLSIVVFKSYFAEFYHYCAPLFFYVITDLVCSLLDRWVLQKFGGSAEQGYFGLSYQISAACFLFSAAMSPLITREFARAHAVNDVAKIRELIRNQFPLLFLIASYLGIFIMANSDVVLRIVGGEKYSSASSVLMLMAVYPIHQTYGQLSGSLLYATGQTSLYRNIGVTSMLIGVPLSFYLLLPLHLGGLNLGAFGLAIKLLCVQLIAVNVQLWFNARQFHISFTKLLLHQCGVILSFATVSFVAKAISTQFFSNSISSFIMSGTLYTFLCIVVIFCFPKLLGVQVSDVLAFTSRVRSMFERK